jgi:hypothetical protein
VKAKFPPQVHTALVTLVTVPDEMVMSPVVCTSQFAALVIVPVYPLTVKEYNEAVSSFIEHAADPAEKRTASVATGLWP